MFYSYSIQLGVFIVSGAIEERTWMDNFLDDGFIDSFREIHQTDVKYSWWSYMGRVAGIIATIAPDTMNTPS